MRVSIALISLSVLVASFLAGGLIGYKRPAVVLKSVGLLRSAERFVMSQILDGVDYWKWEYGQRVGNPVWIDRVHPLVLKTDAASLIDISGPEAAREKRQGLIDLVWRGRGLPMEHFPDEIIKGVGDPEFADLDNLRRIDQLVVRMPHGVISRNYLFLAERGIGQTVIYHQGHFGHFALGKPTINAFLEAGYDVVGMSMPMLGPNSGPTNNVPRFGYIEYKNHNLFNFFQTANFNPLSYFVEPIVAVVNHLRATTATCSIATGISGGGWLVTLAAAMDQRICRTYPVAGSLPAYVRLAPPNVPNIGDYEEMRPELLAIANVLEIYVLAATGEDRAHIMIYNQFDDCCYRGTGALTFRDPVRQAVDRAGGGYADVIMDSTHVGHLISPFATALILDDLRKAGFGR